MPLTTTLDMLRRAQEGRYAVGAFNIENMEMAQGVVAAAEAMNAPVILATTSSTVGYAGENVFLSIVSALARDAKVPVAMHLDHGSGFDACARAFRAGYTSVMIDGSHLPFEENLDVSARVARMCVPAGVPVEAELGRVGGKEDDVVGEVAYTDPEEAALFVKQTGITSLAIAIGTAHGVYKGEPKLNLDCLQKVRQLVSIPLALHGASGLSDEVVKTCIAMGMCKVNFATELRMAFTGAVRAYLSAYPDAFDPKSYLKQGRKAVEQCAAQRMAVLGCENKA